MPITLITIVKNRIQMHINQKIEIKSSSIQWNTIKPLKGTNCRYMLCHEWTSTFYTKWKAIDTKNYILSESIYMKCPDKASLQRQDETKLFFYHWMSLFITFIDILYFSSKLLQRTAYIHHIHFLTSHFLFNPQSPSFFFPDSHSSELRSCVRAGSVTSVMSDSLRPYGL